MSLVKAHSNEYYVKKDSPDQKSGFGFAERNAKSVLRSKIRFWIHRKEHTLSLFWRILLRSIRDDLAEGSLMYLLETHIINDLYIGQNRRKIYS